MIVLCAIVGAAVWACIRDWSYLLETGGWYAVLGHFVMVTVLLSFAFMTFSAVIAMIITPVLILFAFGNRNDEFDPAWAAAFDWRSAGNLRGAAGRAAWRVADGAWRASWRCGWFVAGFFRRPPG